MTLCRHHAEISNAGVKHNIDINHGNAPLGRGISYKGKKRQDTLRIPSALIAGLTGEWL